MKNILLTAGLVALVGAGMLLADTKVDYSHHTNFDQYHTYSWLKVSAGNQLWTDRIKRAVNAELMAKGWMEVPSGGQVAVSAFGSTKNQPSMQTFYDGLGGGWGWYGFGGEGLATTTVQNNEIGTLTVDMFDANSKKLIFRGTATKALSDNPNKNEKKLESEVHDMFKKFPPKEKAQSGL